MLCQDFEKSGSRHFERPVFLSGLACRTGAEILPVARAVAEGRYSEGQAQKDKYTSLRRSLKPVPQMALDVGKAALGEADGTDLGQLVFSGIHDHGEARLWLPAAFLMDQLNAHQAFASNMSFGCNGLALALLQSAMLLPSLPGPALLVGADRFEGTSFDRWQSDKGLAYGDAASAALVSNEEGFAELVFLSVEYEAGLERLHRRRFPKKTKDIWDVTSCKREFMQDFGGLSIFDGIARALSRLESALWNFLNASNVSLSAVITPFVGASVRESTYDSRFASLAPTHSTEFGQSVGHTGTSDQFLGFGHLVDSGAVKPGDHVLLIGAGAGFSVSAIVLRLLAYPKSNILGEI